MNLVRRVRLAVLACCALAGLPAAASAATTIGTAPPGSDFQCQWGVPNTATYGQTIVAPQGDDVLDSFTFYVTQYRDPITGQPGGAADIVYKAYVYEWSGGKAVGSPVWQSADPQTVTTTTDAQPITVETGGVALTSGSQYVLFLSVSETFALNTAGSIACWMYPGSFPHYDDGTFVFLNNGADASKWTAQTWSSGSTDVAFSASFSGSGGGSTIYMFNGFFAPVETRDADGAYVLNVVQAGSAVPMKFSLGGDHGLDIMDAGFPKSEPIACDSQAEVNGIDETVTAGSSSLSYAAGSDTYTYVWKTDKSWSDSCRQFVLKLNDGTTARANFMFR